MIFLDSSVFTFQGLVGYSDLKKLSLIDKLLELSKTESFVTNTSVIAEIVHYYRKHKNQKLSIEILKKLKTGKIIEKIEISDLEKMNELAEKYNASVDVNSSVLLKIAFMEKREFSKYNQFT